MPVSFNPTSFVHHFKKVHVPKQVPKVQYAIGLWVVEWKSGRKTEAKEPGYVR